MNSRVMAGTKRKFTEGQLDQYVCGANDAITFKFVCSRKDLEDYTNGFKPEYTHQLFGDSENIFGYIGLHIDLFYSACHLYPYFGMTCREKVKPSKTGGVEPDDVFKIVCDKYELEPTRDLDAFSASLSKESTFYPYGEKVTSFTVKNEKYEIFRADINVPGFGEYHKRMQTLVLWFIDAASFIEDDERWDFFVLYRCIEDDGNTLYPFIGYATVYRYFAFPKMVRPRISQMMILPPFQKRGLGTKLLESISGYYMNDPDVLDMTVEDPSEDFIRIRDFIDCKKCQTLSSFSEDKLKGGFTQDMLEEARAKFKISKRQVRRVYEILRLKSTNVANKHEYKAYRLDVKNRLNAPFQREKLDLEKLQKTLSQEELKAAAAPLPLEKRMEHLEHMYKEVETKYKHIIERLSE